MNPPKVTDEDDINFLLATPKGYRATEAARVPPEKPRMPAHDAVTGLWPRLEPDTATRWREAAGPVARPRGIGGVEEAPLDPPDATHSDLGPRHWSGQPHRGGDGRNWITLLWTEGDRHVPVAYRLYDKAGDGLTKPDPFQAVLTTAPQRGCVPEGVGFDSGYGRLTQLKLIAGWGGRGLTRLKANRPGTPDRRGGGAGARVETAGNGTLVQLKGYGLIRFFKRVTPAGDLEGGARNALQMGPLTRPRWAGYAGMIAHYPRGIKPCGGVERAHGRAARAQRHHIGVGGRAFLRWEQPCAQAGIRWVEAKMAMIRPAGRAYFANPLYTLPATA